MLSLLAALSLLWSVPSAQVFAPPGGVAWVRVAFPSGSATYNRTAPAELRLSSPWGERRARPTGTPDPQDPEEAFARLDPLRLAVRVPPGTKPGAYPLTLRGALYLCSRQAGQCFRRELRASVTLHVGASGRSETLQLPEALLERP